MSPLDQVLCAAKQLSDEGKNPTLALIKTKLGISVAMPTLIQGLQQYKSMSDADKASIKTTAQVNAAAQEELQQQSANDQQRVAKLEQELVLLKKELKAVTQRLTILESVANKTSEK
ncbi:Conserved hypothetical protein [Shewanella piezotolerans WP3]|uniref:KfrA N-terminal DNA-binding domain-containing protein n=1 Tax=Shewanella piezotolerans (strain WP3 / JCM 13877) TaxID=225849 RepID=B8CQA2_SHEPW|nr:hypothetical protein [Shewanella piezotolerans]ACJ30232.1 Conserved hypothetical protein [Shewanella piezotolerans WP3]